jgi:hypothetical protein
MKRAVSISIGSSTRDKSVEIELLGEKIRLERIGTDGDIEKAARMYQELDGKVDAFGMGGALLGIMLEDKWRLFHSVQSMVRFVEKTPLVDGTGLKMTLERQVAHTIREANIDVSPKRAFVAVALDRWGTARAFLDDDYDCVFGDLMFSLDIPIPLRSESGINIAASIMLPIASRLPFHWIYPTGEAQEINTPKWQKYFQWATVVAGDCHYLTRYMPPDMSGKTFVTNTTTEKDRQIFREAGVKHLITTTPVLDGRSFGTNMMEAALVAAAGRTQPVDYADAKEYFVEMEELVKQAGFTPQAQEL